MRHRVYTYRIGTWLQRDPLPTGAPECSLEFGQLCDSHLYSYSVANPTTLADPLGLVPTPKEIAEKIKEAIEDAIEKSKKLADSMTVEAAKKYCKDWADNEDALIKKGWLKRLPDCPCTAADAKADPGTWSNDLGQAIFNLHPGCDECYRAEAPRLGLLDMKAPPGQQCCYKDGNLVNQGPGAGTPDVIAPGLYPGSPLFHYAADVEPAIICAKAGMSDEYLKRRPPNQGKDKNGKPCPKFDGKAPKP
jgi:hypothetical protein